MRLAWFSPMPPVGRASRAAAPISSRPSRPRVRDRCLVTDEQSPGRSAHDFLWRRHRAPYDLTVYQLGNSSHHDYQWPYLFRFPGLVVLHDAHLHHARAAACCGRGADDYGPSSPRTIPTPIQASPSWRSPASTSPALPVPHDELVVAASAPDRRAQPRDAPNDLRPISPEAHSKRSVLGTASCCADDEAVRLGADARARHGSPPGLVFGCFGGLTPTNASRRSWRVRRHARVARDRPLAARRGRGRTLRPARRCRPARPRGLRDLTGYLENEAA